MNERWNLRGIEDIAPCYSRQRSRSLRPNPRPKRGRMGETMVKTLTGVFVLTCVLFSGNTLWATNDSQEPLDPVFILQDQVAALNKTVGTLQREVGLLKKQVADLRRIVEPLRRTRSELNSAMTEQTVQRFYSRLRTLRAKHDVAFRRILDRQRKTSRNTTRSATSASSTKAIRGRR